MRVALDIETICASGCTTKCECALIPHKARITCIGVWTPHAKFVLRDGVEGTAITQLKILLESLPTARLVGHNLKFDLKMLARHGFPIPLDMWVDDTLLMATASTKKVSDQFLEEYEAQRVLQNDKLPKGYSHRFGTLHSLKTLAPFFLGVPAFWEDPSNHDSDEYVLKDCEYTYRLAEFFDHELRRQDTYTFYKEKLLNWVHVITEAEIEGIPIDLEKVVSGKAEAEARAAVEKEKLDLLWNTAYASYRANQLIEIGNKYEAMAAKAMGKLKAPSADKVLAVHNRYKDLASTAASKVPQQMNLNSPTQLSWILRDHLGLNISDWDGDESTGKAVLQRLAGTGREDIKTFLEYRKQTKLATAFFPTYLELQDNGRIHCNFNPDGTRTGRLSSSMPNLQQVPGDLHSLFKAPPGMELADYDESAIEAKLIAYYSEDPNLVQLCNSGDDFHGFNVVNVYFPELGCHPNEVKALYKPQRNMVKELGYALFYGAGWARVQAVAQKHGYEWSEAECKEKVARFKRVYARVIEFKNHIDQMARTEPITNMFGRKIAYPNHEDIYMKAFNSLIQGSASDMVLHSAWRISQGMKAAGIKGKPLLFVHDEIVTMYEAGRRDEVIPIITHAMTDYHLPTKFGPIRLEVEGKTGLVWEK